MKLDIVVPGRDAAGVMLARGCFRRCVSFIPEEYRVAIPGSNPCGGSAVSLAQGRNHFRGPAYFSTDFTIMKNTKLPGWENAMLGIGFQFFNLFNHPNFGFPDPGLSSSTFGQILALEQSPTGILGSGLGASASPRMIQLKAQLQF